MKFNSKPEDRFMKEIHEKVNTYLKLQTFGSYATSQYWLKIMVVFAMIVVLYFSLLSSTSLLSPLIIYPLIGVFLLLLTLNLAHDAAHNSLSKNHTFNATLFYTSFILNGINPYLWRKRHIYEHHPFPNIPHRDPDLIQVKFLRFSQEQEFRWYHRFQFIYAPILYTTYSLFWIFIKDFKKDVSPGLRFNYWTIISINILVKAFYIFMMLILPLWLNPHETRSMIGGFILMHVIQSLLVVFTFVISHYIDGINNSVVENEVILSSWEMHQINSSVDFHAQSKAALFLFGGFNCHNAHHLFPTVAHVHYPVITQIIESVLISRNIVMNKVSFLNGIGLHLRLLWRNSYRKAV